MNNINRNNYEPYFLDFLEGTISPQDKKKLMLFLDSNQDLREELYSFEPIKLQNENYVYPEKSSLKKQFLLNMDNSDNFDYLCIAQMEGDLSEKESHDFTELIKQNKEKELHYNRYLLCRIRPDESIIFGDKKSLKRNNAFISRKRLFYSFISAAASVIILLTIYFFAQDRKNMMNYNAEILKTQQNPIQTYQKPIIESNKNRELKNVVITKESDNNNLLHKFIVQESDKKETLKQEVVESNRKQEKPEQIAYLDPVNIQLRTNPKSLEMANNFIYYDVELIENEEKVGVKRYLSQSFNKYVFNKDKKEKVDWFDIAQASIKGINKIAGTNMALERVYDEKGNPKATNFNSKLIAFSSPVKKE